MHKTIYKYIACLACLFGIGLTSCNNDEMNADPGTGKTGYYFNLNVSLPSETYTRGETVPEGDSTDGTESGTTKESTIKSAEIYFCQNNEVKFKLEAETLVPRTDGKVTLSAKLEDIEDLSELIEEDSEVQLFVVGNVEEAGISGHTFSKTVDAENAKFNLANLGNAPMLYFGTDGQLMPLVNASEFTFSITQGADAETTLENVKKKFIKGSGGYMYFVIPNTIELERGIARVEFKDDRTLLTPPANDNQAYAEIEELLAEDYNYQLGKLDVVLKLDKMQVYNVNKSSYLFRHTAAGYPDGASEDRELFGNENSDANLSTYKWIATPDWTSTSTGYGKGTDYYNPLVIGNDGYSIEGTLGSLSILNLKRTTPSEAGFYPWVYISENTLPNIDLMEETDENGAIAAKYATGVAFTFLVLDKNGEALEYSADRTNYPWSITNSTTKGGSSITITDTEGYWIDVTPVGGKYYVTYIANIVHNASTSYTDQNFAPMHFGVVRNNTYQMYIKSIKGLPNPKDPKSLYLEMNVEVKKWVRRTNNFEF